MRNTYYESQYTGNKVITWKNFTDTSTPLSAANLQKSHQAISDMDQELLSAFQSVDQTKLDKADAANIIKDVQYNPSTGTFTFKYFDTTKADLVVNTALEKIIVNWSYNISTQKLELIQDDGTTVEVDLSALIAQVDFEDSAEISWNVDAQGKVSASIKNGSITDAKIESGFLSACTQQANAAATSATNADYYSKLSKSYAHGQTNLVDRPSEATDNAMYYAGQAQAANTTAQSAKTDAVDASTNAASSATNASNSASAAALSAQTASDKAEDAEAIAFGTRNGVDVSSSDPCYNNNAKYYSEQASDAASDAAQSASDTQDLVDDAEAWATGQKQGTDVPSTDPTYHNNAKYYAEQISGFVDDAEDAAELSKSWAQGDSTSGRTGENTNNSKYWSQQSQSSASAAAESAAIAASYSSIILPEFYIDFTTMKLMQKDVPTPSNIQFSLTTNKHLEYVIQTT